MTVGQRTLFLVDADNVSLEVIEKALSLKRDQHGAMHVRRCYCSADFATKNLEFLREHSIRAMVNATAGKNCTDIALAVDAVQLCVTACPSVVVIAPLRMRIVVAVCTGFSSSPPSILPAPAIDCVNVLYSPMNASISGFDMPASTCSSS